MNKSIWDKNIKAKTTNKNIETDILIIGGGITGITTMLYLLNTNKKITLIEANKIGSGITNKTTAKISIMQEYNYQKIKKTNNNLITQKYLESQIYATKEIKKIIKNYNIDCDFEKNDSYLFTNTQENVKKIILEKNILEKQIKCEVISTLPNNYPCLYGIKTKSYVFNPLKYIESIIKICQNKINIYENIKAIDITKKLDYYLIKTNKNKIKAKQIIICTNYPFIKKLHLPIKTKIEKEYTIAAKTNKTYKMNAIANDNELISIRYYNKYLIYCSTQSILQKDLNHKQNITNVINNYKKHFNYPIKYIWYNKDITSNDYLPIIGKIKDDNIYIATAYNKWGMTNGVLAAKIISDLIKNKKNNYIELFSPYRKNNIKKISNSINYSINSAKMYLNKKQNNIKYITKNGIEYAIYIDESNIKHEVKSKCPHMKCRLLFNTFDKTWDCPCHGSRFTIDGKLLNGPSTKNIKKSIS